MAESKYPQAKIRGTASELVRIYLGEAGWLGDPPLEMPLAEAERRLREQDWNVSAKAKVKEATNAVDDRP